MLSRDPKLAGSVWTEADALRAIWERSAYDRGYVTNPFAGDAEAGLGLRRTAALLEALGRPHERAPIVHVAGSKGKGSTCVMIAAMLNAAGHRVGVYISPHLHRFRERFIVGDGIVAPDAFAAAAQRVFAATARLESDQSGLGRLTAFEIATALAFVIFADAGCDVAVIEVGMGGTLDATNIVDPAVSVITRLDYEHVAVLGPGMAEIAGNKAGIIKRGRPAVSVHQEPVAETVILAAAARAGASLLLQGHDWNVAGDWRSFSASGPWGTIDRLASGLAGDHQMENAGAAIAAWWAARDRVPGFDADVIRRGLASVRWPGRYERVARAGRPEIILDGAHTPASAAALARTLATEPVAKRIALVVGMFSDKDPAAFLAAFAGAGLALAGVVAAPVASPRAADPASVQASAAELGMPASIAPNLASAVSQADALAGPAGRVVITGSLTLVASARELLGLADGHDAPLG